MDIHETPQIGERRDLSLDTEIRQSSKDEGVFTFVISTGDKDRHGTRVNPDGVDFESFKSNPVVLFNHDYNRIIGTASNIRRAGDKIIADMRFDEDGFSQEIKGKVERGVLRATSIGFMVKEWSYDEEEDTWKIMQSELLEFSVVTVPSNRNALIMRDAEFKSLQSTVEKLVRTVERQAQIVESLIEVNGSDLASAVKRDQSQGNDQDDQEEPGVAESTLEDDLTTEGEPVPDKTESESAEAGNDPSHNTADPEATPSEESAPEEKQFDYNELMKLAQNKDLRNLARSTARRLLGKE